jgi:hypothetical protein
MAAESPRLLGIREKRKATNLFDRLLPGLGGKSIVGRRRSVTNVTGEASGERRGLISIEDTEHVTDKTSDLVGLRSSFSLR